MYGWPAIQFIELYRLLKTIPVFQRCDVMPG
jgi:hypothetical protein